jgi:transcriptional regulator with XRE-family HTH domain
MNFGDAEKKIRTAEKKTQQQIADQAGISRSTIANIEGNKISPSYETARKIFRSLHLTANEFEAFRLSDEKSPFKTIEFEFKHLLNSGAPEGVKILYTRITNLPEDQIDQTMAEMKQTLEAMLALQRGDFGKANQLALPVWNSLFDRPYYLEVELFMANDLMFVATSDGAERIVTTLLAEIRALYPDLISLKLALLQNLAYLFIRENQFEKASQYLSNVMTDAQAGHRMDHLIAARTRILAINGEYDLARSLVNSLEHLNFQNQADMLREEIKEIIESRS